MNDVRMPIETSREGNKITKVCVENIYKITNRVIAAMDKAYNNSLNIINTTRDDKYGKRSSVIHARGTSQPSLTDAFDEQIGSDVAFIKMKLNANIKKHNFLVNVWNEFAKACDTLDNDLVKIDSLILDDLYRMRLYNPEYLTDIEYELGIYNKEDKTEDEI